MSPANLQLVRLLQQDEVLCDSIVASRQSWHATALIHGELKPPHCLVTRPSARGGPTGLTLVDFENAGLGEPGWDVGCVVAAFLGRWVMSISSAAPSHSRVPAARAPVPLPHVQAGIRAFWHAYATQMGLTIGHLERALPHAISRMVWSVFESCTGRNVLPEQALVTLQLAHNLGARPRDGIRYVLGLDGN